MRRRRAWMKINILSHLSIFILSRLAISSQHCYNNGCSLHRIVWHVILTRRWTRRGRLQVRRRFMRYWLRTPGRVRPRRTHTPAFIQRRGGENLWMDVVKPCLYDSDNETSPLLLELIRPRSLVVCFASHFKMWYQAKFDYSYYVAT